MASIHHDDSGGTAFTAELRTLRIGVVRERILLFLGLLELRALLGDQLLLSYIQLRRTHHPDHDQVLFNNMAELGDDSA